jgi:prolyl 4-hydroxylase
MVKTDISVLLNVVWTASLIVSSWMVSGVHTELYTCLADMEELLETEALLIRTLDGYIQAQEDKLKMLRRLVNVPSFQFWLLISIYLKKFV